MENKFFRCEHCGKIINVVKESGVPILCCGQRMTQLVAGATDAAQEKHIPVFNRIGDKLVVVVGSIEHPMAEEHNIEWVAIDTNQGTQIKYLKPGDKPVVTFALSDEENVKAIYAYCNLHSLWKADYQNTSECEVEKIANGDYLVCKCNKVSYMDIINQVENSNNITNLLDVFEKVKDTTHCSTGCGGCYEKVIAIISDTINGQN